MHSWEVEYKMCCRTQRRQNGLPRSERYYQAESALQPLFTGCQEQLRRLAMETDGGDLIEKIESVIRLEAELIYIIRMLSLFVDEDFVFEDMKMEIEHHALEDYWLGLEYEDELNRFKLLGFIAEEKTKTRRNGR